ncbi:hypothetical protein VNI00_005652 [Paramarasmius palmivorus]|uniref:Uncharacterized protein n=1 Tax=Paramarasmius palmivorus TaxID=297713 RepID=A0AAW0DAR9_9AGAR
MKGSALFSPSTWRRKKKVAETSTSDLALPSFSSLPSLPRPSIHVGGQYSPLYAQSAIDLGSPVRSTTYNGRPSFSTIHESKPAAPSRPLHSVRKHSDPTLNFGGQRPTHAELMHRSTSSGGIPRRPPRPPSLERDAPKPPKAVTRTSVESERPTLARRTQSNTLPQGSTGKHLRPKGSMPELDGVWKGFLEEVDEDFTTLGGNHSLTPRTANKQRRRSNTVGLSPSSSRFKDLPPSPSFDKEKFNLSPPSPVVRSHSESPPRSHRLGNDDDALSRVEYESPPPSPTPDFPLSLFPTPPPLVIKKKLPTPLILKPKPRTPILSPVPSPSTSSSDSTPIATPTTPTQMSHLSPKQTSPPGILRTSCRDSPSLPHNSPVSSKRPLNRLYPTPPIIRTSQSVSHLSSCRGPRPAPSHVHRTTSSDSISSSSTCSSDDPIWTFSARSHSTYLKSSGRRPRQSAHQTAVEFGVAV